LSGPKPNEEPQDSRNDGTPVELGPGLSDPDAHLRAEPAATPRAAQREYLAEAATPHSGVSAVPRVQAVWHQWLATLASDPEAAYAAALAYRQLDGAQRDQWLEALEGDSLLISVPRIAIYAPLMAVESDRTRRRRMEAALCGGKLDATSQATPATPGGVPIVARGLLGLGADGVRLAVLVGPLYLGFVQVLACAYVRGERFLWVRHDPIAKNEEVLRPGATFEGFRLTAEPLGSIIDELAATILAHQRSCQPIPDALRLFADWFGPGPLGEAW
jgi:hypothetical protein